MLNLKNIISPSIWAHKLILLKTEILKMKYLFLIRLQKTLNIRGGEVRIKK